MNTFFYTAYALLNKAFQDVHFYPSVAAAVVMVTVKTVCHQLEIPSQH